MEHSFSPEQLRRVLGSSEGRQLLALLSSGCGERRRRSKAGRPRAGNGTPAACPEHRAGTGAVEKTQWMIWSARYAPY